ncbi:MAG: FAD-linked oxidase C-terminal domain-containing protein [Gammaproteobacteria bacterium]
MDAPIGTAPHHSPDYPKARAARLAAALQERVRGEVRFDEGSRALYATDASNYRQVPIGVVVPRDVDDLVEAVAVCREYEAPLFTRGGGTSLAGQCCNAAVVLDISRHLNRILELDPQGRTAVVEPGCVLDDLRDAAEVHHLTFGPDPSTHDHCTLGGMIGNNSCGVHSVMAGRTADNVEALEVLTYDGERMWVGACSAEELAHRIAAGGRQGQIYRELRELCDRYADLIRERYPRIPRRVSGYNLDELLPEKGFHLARALVGSESTCVTILKARLRLIPSPPSRVLLVLGYPDVYAAAAAVPDLLEAGPIGLEGIDEQLVENIRRKHLHPERLDSLPPGGAWLLVEFGAVDPAAACQMATRFMDRQRGDGAPGMRLVTDAVEQASVWKVRESALGATAHVPGHRDTWPGWEDASVPPARLADYLRAFRVLLARYGYEGALYGHFGDGCVHSRISFDLGSTEGVSQWRRFLGEAAELVVAYGGSLSGEHGDGQARADLLPQMYGEQLMEAMRRFKAVWDPQGRMNPGKIVDPYPVTGELRLGPERSLPEPETRFRFPDDGDSFVRVVSRCVGVGKCRRQGGGVMCPSFMATREEQHSTRGRARLLFEMLEGDPLDGGWRSEAVHEALDLCLSCKACRQDCPVNVDMATYKAEFNYHYYRGRRRPREAYAMGLIHWWARAAARAPHLVNALNGTPALGGLLKAIAGIARQRRLPRFAAQTFQRWFRLRGSKRPEGRPVVLWPDTFYNHFHPQAAAAAVAVLEAAGHRVEVPQGRFCCARPLFAWGWLELAAKQLRHTLDVLEPWLERDLPVLGMEPACIASFRDELPHLLPDDPRAARLARQAQMLGEYLVSTGYQPPRLERRALVHVHCNHHAVMGFDGERNLLARMGLELDQPETGCCGMAGPFGYEAAHYAVAMQCGERVLLPAVRAAAPASLVVTDGYACREQIAQSTPRRALHLAEVLHMALRDGYRGTAAVPPERAFPEW